MLYRNKMNLGIRHYVNMGTASSRWLTGAYIEDFGAMTSKTVWASFDTKMEECTSVSLLMTKLMASAFFTSQMGMAATTSGSGAGTNSMGMAVKNGMTVVFTEGFTTLA